jgi:hypothetical protein
MKRILLVLSLFLLASLAHAGSARTTDDAEMNCPKPGGKSVAASVVAPQSQTPVVTVGHGIPSGRVHSAAAPRVISPRWHSFLPGMFR